jgi:hypothetical protein
MCALTHVRSEIRRLRGGDGSEWTFRLTRMRMHDDGALSAAFGVCDMSGFVYTRPCSAVSQRYEQLPVLTPDGTFTTMRVRYIDALALAERLRWLNASQPLSASVRTVHVPVFMFSLGSDMPMLVDSFCA